MNNNDFLKARWKVTENSLKQLNQKIERLFKDVSDELIELYKLLDINHSNINKLVPDNIKRKLLKKIAYWKEKNLDKGYFGYLIKTTKRYTYSNVLTLLIFGIYNENNISIMTAAKEHFFIVARNSYDTARNDLNLPPFSPEILTWAYISKFLQVLSANMSFEEYLDYLALTSSNEAKNKLLTSARQEIDIDQKDIKKMIQKQKNRIINVHDEKFSGVIDTLSIKLGNDIYIDPFKTENRKVKFIAEIDDRTTRMCLSLDKQVFNTIEKNVFTRWSAEEGLMKRYEIDGLVEGINLPPITDHFHYCRSSITYQV